MVLWPRCSCRVTVAMISSAIACSAGVIPRIRWWTGTTLLSSSVIGHAPAARAHERAVKYLFKWLPNFRRRDEIRVVRAHHRLRTGTSLVGLLIDPVVCLSLAEWETVSGRFGGYLTRLGSLPVTVRVVRGQKHKCVRPHTRTPSLMLSNVIHRGRDIDRSDIDGATYPLYVTML